MNRLVRGSDGRMWNVRANLEWSNPIATDEWENDVAGGRGPGVLMAVILFVLAMVLVLWRPTEVIVPPWLILALVLVALFFPTRWLLRRPWTVIAETPGDEEERPPERWVGVVRGMMAARQEGARVARNIEVYSEPDMNGPLQPVE